MKAEHRTGPGDGAFAGRVVKGLTTATGVVKPLAGGGRAAVRPDEEGSLPRTGEGRVAVKLFDKRVVK